MDDGFALPVPEEEEEEDDGEEEEEPTRARSCGDVCTEEEADCGADNAAGADMLWYGVLFADARENEPGDRWLSLAGEENGGEECAALPSESSLGSAPGHS